jgi:hypothetical protein
LASPFAAESLNATGVYTPALQEHRALGVGIENRYYGRSLNADMLMLQNIIYHTFEQSLQVKTNNISDKIS